MMVKKSGQIWVETVIYTLIGLAIIGILLAASKPKIDSMKDRLIIEQTIESMNAINEKIQEVYSKGPGNKRVLDLKVSRGKLILDTDGAEGDGIYWILDSEYEYSELDTEVPIGKLNVLTTKGEPWEIKLSVDYNFDLTYGGEDAKKEIGSASTPYLLTVENMGLEGGKIVVDLRVS